jgi:hypothetical protein
MMMEFEKLNEGVADCARTFELINRGYSPDVFRAGQWFECAKEEFYYFLEVLPPLDFQMGAFSMCEFSTGRLTNAFISRADRFFCLTIERRNAADFVAWIRGFDQNASDKDPVGQVKVAA